MKKVVIFYFALLSIFILSACDSKGFQHDNASNSRNKTETPNTSKPQSAVSNNPTNKETVNSNSVTGEFSNDDVMNSDEVINANKKK